MANRVRLSGRERLFCSRYIQLGEGEAAALRAGCPPGTAAEDAVKLLAKKAVREEIDRLRQQERRELEALALAGLRRIAFGGIGGAVKLMMEEELSPSELSGLDLFAVSELKRPRGGGWEIKFHDRLRALDLLVKYSESGAAEAGQSLLEALDKSAAAIAGEGEWKPDAV